MAKKLKYPDASSICNKYRQLSNDLGNNYTKILNYVNRARNVFSMPLENADANGDYYSTYTQKRKDWIDLHDKQISQFDNFLRDLSTCIQNANNLADMWSSRIGIEEDDN